MVSKRALISPETHLNGEIMVYSVLKATSAPQCFLVTQHFFSIPKHPLISSPSRLKYSSPPGGLGQSCLSYSSPPPSLKVNPHSSDSHVFLGSGSQAERAVDRQRWFMWGEGGQELEAEEDSDASRMRKQRRAGPQCLGCLFDRWSRDVTGCCLSPFWSFCTFTRPLWMDGCRGL